MWATSAVLSGTQSLTSFGLPHGKTIESYFVGVSAAGASMLSAMFLLVLIEYVVFIYKGRNTSQFIGIALILFTAVIFGTQGISSLGGVLGGIMSWAWAWITG